MALATLAISVTSCKKDQPLDGLGFAIIEGIIADGANGSAREGVTVSWYFDGAEMSTTTDTDGYYQVPDVSTGVHSLTIAGDDGYSAGRLTVRIPTFDELLGDENTETKEEDIVYHANGDAPSFPNTTTILGELVSGGNALTSLGEPLADATVHVTALEAIAGFDLVSDTVTGTAGADGSFMFENLPSTGSFLVTVDFYNDGTTTYEQWNSVINAPPGSVYSLGRVELTNTAEAPYLIDDNFAYLSGIPLDHTFTFTFSKAMADVGFIILDCDGDIPFTSTISGGTVTVDPDIDLPVDTECYIDFLLATADGALVDAWDYYTFGLGAPFDTDPGIQLLDSNILDAFGDEVENHPIADDITFTFDRPPTDWYAELYDETEEKSIHISTSLAGNVLSINPTNNLLPNDEYYVYVEYETDVPDDSDYWEFTFYTNVDGTAPPTPTGFVWINPDRDVDYDDDGPFGFEVLPTPDADGFCAYTFSDRAPQAAFYDCWSQNDVSTIYTGAVKFDDGEHDQFQSDARHTPFSASNVGSVFLIAYNDYGESAPTSALTLSDNVDPTATYNGGAGVIDNTGGTDPETYTVQFGFSEYVNVPVVAVTGNDAAITYTTDFDFFARTIDIEFTIPVDKNLTDTMVTVTVTDTSGNTDAEDSKAEVTITP